MDLQKIVDFIIEHPGCTVSELATHFKVKAGAMSTIMSNLSNRPDVTFKKEEALSPSNRKTFTYTYVSGVIDPDAKSTYAQKILERKAEAKAIGAANRLARKAAVKNGAKLTGTLARDEVKSMSSESEYADSASSEELDVNAISPEFLKKSNEPSVVYKKSKRAKITMAAITEKKVAEVAVLDKKATKNVVKKKSAIVKDKAMTAGVVVPAQVEDVVNLAEIIAAPIPTGVEVAHNEPVTVVEAKQEFAATVEQAGTALSTQFNEHAISNSQNIAIMMEIMRNLSVTANNLSQAFLADLQNPKVVKLSNQIAEIKHAVQAEMQQEVGSIRDSSTIAASAKPSASAIKAMKSEATKIIVSKPVSGNRLSKVKPAKVGKPAAQSTKALVAIKEGAEAVDIIDAAPVKAESVKAAAVNASVVNNGKKTKKDVIVLGCANAWRKNLNDELRKDFNLVFVESTGQLIDQYGVMGAQDAEVAILVNMLPNEDVVKGKLQEAKIPFTALTGTSYSLQKHLKKQIGVI